MTNEEKQLLLIDLCARLPFGVKFASFCEDMVHHSEPVILRQIYWNEDYNANGIEGDGDMSTIIEFVKPYLRPMSSMTEEEKNELRKLCNEDLSGYAKFIFDGHGLSHDGLYLFYPLRQLDFINSHHFDFRGLIQKGLALEAPEDMYKTE